MQKEGKTKKFTTTNPENRADTKSIAEDLFKKADELRTKNKFKEALEIYLHSVFLNRNSAKAYLGLGLTYKELKKYPKSVNALKKATKLAPFDSSITSNLGISQLINGDYGEAIKSFQRAIRLKPDDYDIQLQLAIAHEMCDEEEMALMIYQRIIEKSPDYLKAHIQKATLYLNLEDYENALDVFRDILALDKSYERAYLGIAICFDKQNKKEEALKYYKHFLDLKPKSSNIEEVELRIGELKHSVSQKSILRVVH